MGSLFAQWSEGIKAAIKMSVSFAFTGAKDVGLVRDLKCMLFFRKRLFGKMLLLAITASVQVALE